MHMDLFMLIFLSMPEFLLNMLLMLIIAGKKNKLKFNKVGNVIQFAVALALMLTATWLIRPHASSPAQSLVCHSIAYVLIILVVYRINPVKVVLGVAWTILYQNTLENTFIPFVIAYFSKGLTAFYGSHLTLILVSLPVRIFQALAVIYFYKNDEFLGAIRGDKKYNIVFAASCYLLTLAEVFISYIYYTFFDEFSFVIQLLFSCSLLALILSFYIAIFGFIYIIVKKFSDDVKNRDMKQRQLSAISMKKVNDKKRDTLEELYSVLQSEKYTGKAIDILKNHLLIEEGQEGKKVEVSGLRRMEGSKNESTF